MLHNAELLRRDVLAGLGGVFGVLLVGDDVQDVDRRERLDDLHRVLNGTDIRLEPDVLRERVLACLRDEACEP